MKKGVILVNLGTPDGPTTVEVRRFLREFLSDPRVIDLSFPFRWLLLNLVILPFRPRRSAKAYASIWTREGSPLMVHSRALEGTLSELLEKENIPVVLSMRYGNPSIKDALKKLHELKCERLLILPLFPQHASSTTGSIREAVFREADGDLENSKINVVRPFFNHMGFINAFVERGRPFVEKEPEHIVFSFHGLPERHLTREDEKEHGCLRREECCDSIVATNQNCYRAQCFRTAELIAGGLQLKRENWSVSFQSRLGRGEWIKPYTEQKIRELARKGLKQVTVFCPAFVSDCLETLEEIAIGCNEAFRQEGGEKLSLVPSLNADTVWVSGLTDIIQDSISLG